MHSALLLTVALACLEILFLNAKERQERWFSGGANRNHSSPQGVEQTVKKMRQRQKGGERMRDVDRDRNTPAERKGSVEETEHFRAYPT